ncbi:MAG: hypothetical protein HYZ74_07950 [Elusimicrobia bacterium]|nr:hypothetical protein [Elusimicrobiota bacterium]
MRRVRLAAVLGLVCAVSARAAFEDAGYGPRDAAMGGAFCAVGDDPAVIAYNPASLGQSTALEVAGSYIRSFHAPAGQSDRDSSRATLVAPARRTVFNGAFGFDAHYDRRTGFGNDRGIEVAYGTRGLIENEGRSLDFGLGLKSLNSSFDAGGKPVTRMAADLGALWRASDRHAVGVSILNAGGATFKSNGFSDRAPLALKIGFAEQLRGVTLAVDLTKREPSAGLRGRHNMGLGFERWWATARAGQFALRSGLSLGDQARTAAWGLGWRAQGTRIDYAMIIPMSGIARLGHGFSMTFRFGRSDPEVEYEKLLSQELRYRRELAVELQAGAVKQGKLSEEIGRLREEIAALRGEIEKKRASEGEAKRRLKDLETRQKEADETFERLKAERERQAIKTKTTLFEEDWHAYQKAKLSSVPDSILQSEVNRLLREYKDSGVDLSEANQELRRLQLAK